MKKVKSARKEDLHDVCMETYYLFINELQRWEGVAEKAANRNAEKDELEVRDGWTCCIYLSYGAQ